MVRAPSFDNNGLRKGAWSEEEDDRLRAFIQLHGHPNWRLLPFLAGLARCGKSCRLRWVNYLKPGLKKVKFSKEEEDLIIKLHNQLGNKWSAIAKKFPGRTDNDIKNYWHAHIKKLGNRNQVVTKVTSAKKGQEQQSSEIICCTDDQIHQEETDYSSVFAQVLSAENPGSFNPINADTYLVEQDQGDLLTEAYDHASFSQLNMDLPTFPEEEFFDFGSCQNDTYSTFSDSSDNGFTSSDSTPEEYQGSFCFEPFEDDTFDMLLW